MIIPQSPQLRSEDYDATTQSWIGRLLSPINSFITSVTSAINGRLTFSDNMLGQEKAFSFTYQSNTFPLNFMLSFQGTAKSLQVVAATEDGAAVAVVPAWSASDKTITISYLTKLSAAGAASALRTGSKYNLTVRVAA